MISKTYSNEAKLGKIKEMKQVWALRQERCKPRKTLACKPKRSGEVELDKR